MNKFFLSVRWLAKNIARYYCISSVILVKLRPFNAHQPPRTIECDLILEWITSKTQNHTMAP